LILFMMRKELLCNCAEDALVVLGKGIISQALEDAITVCALFNVTTRCADTPNYRVLLRDFDRAARQLLVQGYAFGKEKAPPHPDHCVLADAVRQRILFGRGRPMPPFAKRWQSEQPEALRFRPPYDEFARQIGEAAYKITDEQMAKVVEQAGSEKAAFELTMAAALGSGLHRFWRGLNVLEAAQKM
jgi:hypothetical protein